MKMDYLLSCLGIRSAPPGHKHYRQGWINIECPWCTGNPGYHLGWNVEGEYFYCWRCGWHDTKSTIRKLAEGLDWRELSAIIERADGIPIPKGGEKRQQKEPEQLDLPSGCGPLQRSHKLYLEKRGLDPEEIEKEWGVLGTGPVSVLDGLDFKYRILAPIFWRGQMVSFQARDITEKSSTKYKACPTHKEIINHKDIIYLHPESLSYNSIIVAEGIFDVWKLGKRSAATFGIGYKISQVRILASLFDRIVILFDNEPKAQAQASKLASELSMLGKKAKVERLPNGIKDPGSLLLSDARKLAQDLLS